MTTTDQIKELRSQTGVGIGDCKSALERSNGDLEKAKLLLREQGKKLTAGAVAGDEPLEDTSITMARSLFW